MTNDAQINSFETSFFFVALNFSELVPANPRR